MRDFLLKTYIRFRHDQEGVTLVEYGIALAVALGILAVVQGDLSGAIIGSMESAIEVMPDAPVAAGG